MLTTDAFACIALSLEAQLRGPIPGAKATLATARALLYLLATSRTHRSLIHATRVSKLAARARRNMIHAMVSSFADIELENMAFPIHLRVIDYLPNDWDPRAYIDYVFFEDRIATTNGLELELTHFEEVEKFNFMSYASLRFMPYIPQAVYSALIISKNPYGNSNWDICVYTTVRNPQQFTKRFIRVYPQAFIPQTAVTYARRWHTLRFLARLKWLELANTAR